MTQQDGRNPDALPGWGDPGPMVVDSLPDRDPPAGSGPGVPPGYGSAGFSSASDLPLFSGHPLSAPPPMPRGGGAVSTDVVTCPECGQLATVDMARRQAEDFCRKCDFPLFWARGTVIAPEGAESGASLRRLPGTVGRAATAALICPHCSEPNSPAAEICVRCALSLHPVDIPEPEPVIVQAPEPAPQPPPEPARFDWWWIVALVTVLMAVALVVAIIALR